MNNPNIAVKGWNKSCMSAYEDETFEKQQPLLLNILYDKTPGIPFSALWNER